MVIVKRVGLLHVKKDDGVVERRQIPQYAFRVRSCPV
jgi:hypothetical protein